MAVLLIIGVQFFADWYKFYSQNKKLDSITKDLIAGSDTTLVKYDKHCMYGHYKFSRGSVGCTIEKEFVYKNISNLKDLFDRNKTILFSKGWKYIGDNTEFMKDNGYVLSNIYRDNGFDCFEKYKNYDNKTILSVGCNKDAKWEWYSVRER